jgi:hypothetical protein
MKRTRAEIKKQIAELKEAQQALKNELASVEKETILMLDPTDLHHERCKYSDAILRVHALLNKEVTKNAGFLNVRRDGEFANRGFFLGYEDDLDWRVVQDDHGAYVLVPAKNL